MLIEKESQTKGKEVIDGMNEEDRMEKDKERNEGREGNT